MHDQDDQRLIPRAMTPEECFLVLFMVVFPLLFLLALKVVLG